MPELHTPLLAAHIAAGALGLFLGPLAIWLRGRERRRRAGAGYHAAVLAVCLTALGLAALDWSGLWWLVPLAAFSYGCVAVGRAAPRRRWPGWVRLQAHGLGGSYIALVTAFLVVSFEELGPAAWVVPTLVGLVLIERRVARVLGGGPASLLVHAD